MNTRNQLILTHSAIVMALGVFFGSFILTGWLPPPSPTLTNEALAAMFTPDNYVMRIGVLLMCFVSPLVVGFAAVIATQLKRIEGEHHVMANLQYVSAAAGLCLFLIPGFIWLAISYRSGTSPELIRVLNDLAWFMFLAGASPTILQWLCIGIAIIGDPSPNPIYPRWLAYLNFWLAFGAVSGQAIPFVKSGPFAYNGFFGFWMVAFVFFFWVSTTYWCTLQAVRGQARLEARARTRPLAAHPATS
jgi:hypothetical protein